jgi:hypothetical protein
VTERSAGFGIFWARTREIDAELAEFDDRRSAPADRVGRERQGERHPVCLAQGLAVAQDAVVPGRRFDRKAHGLEAADEVANVLPHIGPAAGSWGLRGLSTSSNRNYQLRARERENWGAPDPLATRVNESGRERRLVGSGGALAVFWRRISLAL